jgi:hypothetical protein
LQEIRQIAVSPPFDSPPQTPVRVSFIEPIGDNLMRSSQTAAVAARPMTAEEKKVIFASSLGTVFEWYDFYLYGSLAAIIAKQFFSGLG